MRWLLLGLACGGLAGCECSDGPSGAGAVCGPEHPELCEPQVECSSDWSLTIAPQAATVPAGAQLEITSNTGSEVADPDAVQIYYAMTVSASADVSHTAVGRYAEPLALTDAGLTTVRARFACDPADSYRTAVTVAVLPEIDLELVPAEGDYRELVDVHARADQPASLTIYMELSGPGVASARVRADSVRIPPTGQSYALRVTATDWLGYVVAHVEGQYSSDPSTPEVVSVSGGAQVSDLEAFTVLYDRAVTGTQDPSGLDDFYHVQLDDYQVRLYPKGPLPAGALNLSSHLRAWGQGGAYAARDPEHLLSAARDVCACDVAAMTIADPVQMEHFLLSPPTAITVESTVALNPDSFVLVAESLGYSQQVQVLPADILDSNPEGTYWELSLAGAGLLMGGYYALTVHASSTHALDPALEASVQISTQLPGAYLNALDVTAAAGVVLGNHWLQSADSEGWAWFAHNPYVLAPITDTAFGAPTLAVQDVQGASQTLGTPERYANQTTNTVYRTMSLWPSANGTSYIQDWSELAVIATYNDRDAVGVYAASAVLTFDDGRVFTVLMADRVGPTLTLSLPPSFYDYPATTVAVSADLVVLRNTGETLTYPVAVTFVVDVGQLQPHFVRGSWSWFAMMDTATSVLAGVSAGVSAMYADAASSVTLSVSAPLPVTTVAFGAMASSRWTVSGASLGAITSAGVYPGTLRMRDGSGTLLDQMDVPIPAVPNRPFATAVSGVVDQSVDDAYVLEWSAGFDALHVVGLAYIQLFADSTVDCANPGSAALQQVVWPADVPQMYIPVAGLDPGLYGICASLFISESYSGSGFSLWQTRMRVQVQ